MSYDSLELVQGDTNGTSTGKSDSGDILSVLVCLALTAWVTRNVHFKGFAPLATTHGATDRVYFWYFRLSPLVLVGAYTQTDLGQWLAKARTDGRMR